MANAEILVDLREFFEDGALYSEVLFKKRWSRSCTEYKLKEIESWCENCQASKPFHNMQSETNIVFEIPDKADSGIFLSEFACVTCIKSIKRYFCNYELVDFETFKITKCGEIPQKPLERNKDLQKFFGKDKENFNKGNVCLANGYGIGAFAYFRRIIEDNISNLLDSIASDEDADESMLNAIAELKAASPMSNRIDIAKRALPPYLMMDGHNPLGAMYGILSEGVHVLSDEECLRRASVVKNCLLFMVSELANHKRRKEVFKDNLDLINQF